MKINGLKIKSEDDILHVLAKVESGNEEFAILESDNFVFMQTADGELEHRDQERHYRVADVPVRPEKIKAAFLSYYRGDGKYLSDFQWELMVRKGLWDTIKGWFGR